MKMQSLVALLAIIAIVVSFVDARAERTEANDKFAKRGFVTFERDGRLWVFDANSEQLSDFLKKGELTKHVIVPGAGPMGMTLKSSDRETILRYVATKPGFKTILDGERLWVFLAGSDALKTFQEKGEPAKFVIWPAGGPLGMTLKSSDTETLEAYIAAKPGFVTKVVDGRIWIFRPNSDVLKAFERGGEPAKHVIRPGAGPRAMTLKAVDTETLLAYVAAQEGFETFIQDGRVWVFRPGSKELEEFRKNGEPAKHVIRPGAGPLGVTVKAPDNETMERYLIAVAR